MDITPAQATAQAPKRDRFNRFAWRDDVFADTDVSAPLKCLAHGIARFINRETGEAVVGTRKLAEVCGFSQAWVRKQVPLFAATGWAKVKVGHRGSGQDACNTYKMNRNREHPVCSLSDVLQAAPREHFAPSREHTGCSEPLNHKSAPPARSSEYVDKADPDFIDLEPPGERAWRRSRSSHWEASNLLTASST
jgi:hypothetical protein